MKLAVINGSPRGEKSNSKKIGAWITSQQGLHNDLTVDTYYLFKINRQDAYIEDLSGTYILLFIFPLYVDSMPGIVKLFFEKLEQKKQAFGGRPVYFVIHSGFPELIHSRSLERYLKYYATKIMDMNHLGTIIWAGSEPLQMAPDNFFRKKIILFEGQLATILTKKRLPEDISEQLGGKEHISKFQSIIYPITPFKDFYWNSQLKKNKAKKLLKNQPYA
ncbi:MAG: NAD(P)H-dependent oxidoreductase [Vallitaleaceae bacterium]|jgi:hypothetical protein|nr:NAD(P)H-dependent oxidoreductase [Vallitaleaceae bacterium]